MPAGASEVLSLLEGHELSAVTFVRDYIQLHFDGPFLNVYVWPVIKSQSNELRRSQSGFLDALCAQIGQAVVSTALNELKHLELHFENETTISISLRPQDSVKGEAVMFQDGTGKIWNRLVELSSTEVLCQTPPPSITTA